MKEPREAFARRSFLETYGSVPSQPDANDPVDSLEKMMAEWDVIECSCGDEWCTGWRLTRKA